MATAFPTGASLRWERRPNMLGRMGPTVELGELQRRAYVELMGREPPKDECGIFDPGFDAECERWHQFNYSSRLRDAKLILEKSRADEEETTPATTDPPARITHPTTGRNAP